MPAPPRTLRLVRLTAAVALVALVLSVVALVGVLRSVEAGSVEGQEIDLAGRQRRLSERVGLDVTRLAAGEQDDAVVEELRFSATELLAIEHGLLRGDPARDLDGEVPASVRELYSGEGLDLAARLDRFGAAALAIADAPASPPPDAVAAVRDEIEGQRLVLDLNEVVAELSSAADGASDDARTAVVVGLVSVIGLSVGSVALLVWASLRAGADRRSQDALAVELAAEQTRFRRVFENAPIGKALVSLDGTFTDVNPAFCALTGRDRDTLLASTFQDITHPDDLDADLAQVGRLIAGESESYRMEKRYLRSDGTVVPVVLAVAAVRALPGGEDYFIAQVVDISERKRTEEAQQAALEQERAAVARLQDLDRAKSDLVSTVSHELRTPLTSTIGYLELLADGAAGPLSERQTEMVEVADRNSRRLLQLIEDLLALSRIEQQAGRDRSDHADLAEVVAGAAATVAPLADRAGIELAVTHPSPCEVLGRRHELERVVLNVLDNAVKFTPPGGTVTVSCTTDPDHPTDVVVVVADTGIGVPEDELDQLFSRFFRARSAHENAVPGTGLGLAISNEILALSGGRMEMTSSVGVGSSVRIHLPMADRAAVGHAAPTV